MIRKGSVFMVEFIVSQALKMQRKIEIIYSCEKGISRRVIRPIKLENNTLEAYCYTRNSIRKFKIEGILSAAYVINKKAG
jgi:predicted DNA-binding transcriptional regulator YafY